MNNFRMDFIRELQKLRTAWPEFRYSLPHRGARAAPHQTQDPPLAAATDPGTLKHQYKTADSDAETPVPRTGSPEHVGTEEAGMGSIRTFKRPSLRSDRGSPQRTVRARPSSRYAAPPLRYGPSGDRRARPRGKFSRAIQRMSLLSTAQTGGSGRSVVAEHRGRYPDAMPSRDAQVDHRDYFSRRSRRVERPSMTGLRSDHAELRTDVRRLDEIESMHLPRWLSVDRFQRALLEADGQYAKYTLRTRPETSESRLA